MIKCNNDRKNINLLKITKILFIADIIILLNLVRFGEILAYIIVIAFEILNLILFILLIINSKKGSEC